MAHGDPSLSFGTRESVRQLLREEVRREQLVDCQAKVFAEAIRLIGVRLGNFPFESHGSVERVFHESGKSPRISRMIWTPTFWTPWLARSSCRAFSARSRT